MKCHKEEWNNQKIPLQLHHIDGNSGNNMPDNLEILCPTCHSQTDTYSGKNIGKGRYKTGLKVYYGFQKTGISKSCLYCFKEIMTMSHKSQKYCDTTCFDHHTRIIVTIKLENNKTFYELSPKKCLKCEIIIPFDKKGNYKKQKFCSRNCIKRLTKEENKDYIKLSKTKENSYERFLLGNITTTGTIKNILVTIHGHKCMTCLQTEWLGRQIPLQLDHIDGNPSNNMPNNLRNLCPNCHALCPTSKGQNRGKGRASLGLR